MAYCGIVGADNYSDNSPNYRYLRHITDFKLDKQEKKEDGAKPGEIVFSNEDKPTKYLIKHLLIEETMREVIAAFILNKIVPGIAPLNYVVQLEKKDSFVVASRLFENFVTYIKYMRDNSHHDNVLSMQRDIHCVKYFGSMCPRLKPICDTDFVKWMHFSSVAVEKNLLEWFISQNDSHWANVGLVFSDDKPEHHFDNSQPNSSYALIDFGQSLYHADPKETRGVLTNYFDGIDHAEFFLEKLSSFEVDSLEELRPLIDYVNNHAHSNISLDKIKDFMGQKLVSVYTQIEACKLVKKMLNKNDYVAEFGQLTTMPPYVLLNFTLANNRNIVIDFLSSKQDITHTALLINRSDELISSFVTYCLEYNNFDLLEKVILLLSKEKKSSMIYNIIGQGFTMKHLELAKKLVDACQIETIPSIKDVLEKINDQRIKIIDDVCVDDLRDEYEPHTKILTMLLDRAETPIIETTFEVVLAAATNLLNYKKPDKVNKLFDSILDNKVITGDRLRDLENIILQLVEYRLLDVLKQLLNDPRLTMEERTHIRNSILNTIQKTIDDKIKTWAKNQGFVAELTQILNALTCHNG